MNYPQQSFQSMESQMANQMGGNQPPDLIAMLWRWKWLPVLGSLLGVITGLLVWIQMAPQFMAVARIQVLTPSGQNLPMTSLDYGDRYVSGRGDDVIIMQSASVLRNAIDIGPWTSNPRLAGMSKEELITWVRHKDRLVVRPGSKDAATNIIDVTFRCEDAELSAEVVAALIAGYERFIGKEAQVLSTEVLDKLARFRDDYDNKGRIAREEYYQKSGSTNLIRYGKELKDPDTENLLATNQTIGELKSKMRSYAAAIETAESASKLGVGNEEQTLIMLARTTHDAIVAPDDKLNQKRNLDSYMTTDTLSARLLGDSIEPLRDEIRTLSASFGEEHPSVLKQRYKLERQEERYLQMKAGEEEQKQAKEQSLLAMNLKSKDPKERLSDVLGSMQVELMAMRKQEEGLLRLAADLQTKSKEQQGVINELALLEDQMNSINDSSQELKDALNRLTLGTGYGNKVMKRLDVPPAGYPDGPYWWKYLALGAFVGASLFTCLAYLLELADRSYRGPDEIARDLGVPILGHIQMSTLTRKDRKDEKIDLSMVTFHKSKSTASEAFRGVRTAIYFGNQAGSIKVIQITSPVPGDGKSTLAANLANSIAQSGRKTLLMDCDMRRPRLAKLLGVRDDLGLTNVLAGKLTIEEAIQETAIANMHILTCGRRPGNPAELLLSDDFVDVVNALRDKYDYIIMDTPPVLAVSDPANASACSDAVILTLRLRRNLRPIAIRAAQMLQSVNANLLGVVINGVTGRAGYGYGGYRYDGSRSSTGYGGYGYGATYGYGDYYSSSMAEPMSSGKAVRQTSTNGQPATVNGQALANLPQPPSQNESTES